MEIDPGFCRHPWNLLRFHTAKGQTRILFTHLLAAAQRPDASHNPYDLSVLSQYVIVVRFVEGDRMSISASEARQRLFPLLEQVNTDHQPVRITSKAGDAVLMSADDYDSWQETVYLLRSPENARRLMEAVSRDKAGQPALTKSVDELREMAGGDE
jgi:antitoxin YefM